MYKLKKSKGKDAGTEKTTLSKESEKLDRVQKDREINKKFYKFPKKVLELIDQDYFYKLSPEERAYLNQFNAEFYNANKHVIHEKNFSNDAEKLKEVKKGLNYNHNAIYRDLFINLKLGFKDRNTDEYVRREEEKAAAGLDNEPLTMNDYDSYSDYLAVLKEELLDTLNNSNEEQKRIALNSFIAELVNVFIEARREVVKERSSKNKKK